MEIQHRNQLVELLRFLKLPLIGAEIGVAEGLHAKQLMDNGLDRLFLIDTWTKLDQAGDGNHPQEWHDCNHVNALRRMRPFGDKITFLQGKSTEMAEQIADDSLGLVYVDGFHAYEGVKADIHAFYRKLVKGGVMAFHDYTPQYGVIKALNEFVKSSSIKVHLIPDRATEDAGAWIQKP